MYLAFLHQFDTMGKGDSMNPYMKENKKAWNLLAKEHYQTFLKRYETNRIVLSPTIVNELGNINGKKLIHLQCNTGSDTLSLRRLGATVTGIDFADNNILYANRLFQALKEEGRFLRANVLDLPSELTNQFDVVFTSEGAIGWLPDFKKWAETIYRILKNDGYFYLYEIHPFYLMFDEEKLKDQTLSLKYPYFGRLIEQSSFIGGYASPSQEHVNYSWMYSISDVVNALIQAGLTIEYIHEFDSLCYNNGNMLQNDIGEYYYPKFKGEMPLMFSIKAIKR